LAKTALPTLFLPSGYTRQSVYRVYLGLCPTPVVSNTLLSSINAPFGPVNRGLGLEARLLLSFSLAQRTPGSLTSSPASSGRVVTFVIDISVCKITES
jgi:hypothetical protein